MIAKFETLYRQYICGKLASSWKTFGIPFVGSCNIINGSDIRNLYLKLLNPFSAHSRDSMDMSDDVENTATENLTEMEDATGCGSGDAEAAVREDFDIHSDTGLRFYLTDEKGTIRGTEIVMNEPVSLTALPKRLSVLVHWPDKMVERYSTGLRSPLPEIFKSGFLVKTPQESVSLYKCLEAFLKEEPLGPEDMWYSRKLERRSERSDDIIIVEVKCFCEEYCPICKKHCQASKKLDLWRLPEILVIHLKRFSYSRFLKNKLETYVEFPIQDLDLSTYIAYKDGRISNRYMLYAISNHYGSMGGGHYTAFVHHGGDRWYDFDDSHVSPISEDRIKTSAAYVLFYRRVEDV
ncbi:unnamed protein product [Ilex paraguariensis]|uniref:ubiquitinyl hydrolase 1 n=1 Tax=Ilex paraguariensis TaxID=185542 RepID=A0ABC8UUA6_9AQUA